MGYGMVNFQILNRSFVKINPQPVKLLSLAFFFLVCCTTSNKELSVLASDDSTSTNMSSIQQTSSGEFKGEYLVGDGGYWITPVENAWEMRNAPQSEPMFLYFDKIENDTVRVYASKDRSVIFKMYPGHELGMYYENDENWPVSRMLASVVEESEDEETARIMKQRQEEDEKAYSELDTYDGAYTLVTESEGAIGKLKIKYKGERVFSFELSLDVSDVCSGIIKDEFVMDRTQHGFYNTDDCALHFNLNGYSADNGYIVEVAQPGMCTHLSEDCIFSGTYVTLPN